MRYLAKRQVIRVAAVVAMGTFATMLARADSRAQTQGAAPAPDSAAAPSAPPAGKPFADYTGRTEAVQRIEVRPPSPGLLTKIAFKEGGEVRHGEVLFEFDSRQQQVAQELARSEVDRAQAEVSVAQADVARLRPLMASAAVSRQEVDVAEGRLALATASLQTVKAKLQTAQLNLDATRVVSPIDGRIGRAYVSAGNWVAAGDILTVIVSQDPIYAGFDVDERQALQLFRQWRQPGSTASAGSLRIPVKIGLADEEGVPHEGVVDFVDNHLDPKTGTIRFRAIVPNADGLMVPGLFVRVRMPLETPRKP